jgi:cell division protein FtsQ
MTETTTDASVTTMRVQRRRPRMSKFVWVLLGAIVLALLAWLVFASSVFAVKSVAVVGTNATGADAVAAAAQVPIGVPIARLDTTLIGSRVYALAWVGDVEVRRGFPNQAVIAVTEREPVARTLDGKAVDLAGMTFEPVSTGVKGLPQIDATGVGLEAAARVIASLPDDLRARVSRAKAGTRDDVELVLKSGATVVWGNAERSDLKASVLTALLGRQAKRYDVSAPELPTTVGERRS